MAAVLFLVTATMAACSAGDDSTDGLDASGATSSSASVVVDGGSTTTGDQRPDDTTTTASSSTTVTTTSTPTTTERPAPTTTRPTEPTTPLAFDSPTGNIRCNLSSVEARCEIGQATWTAPAPSSPCPLDHGRTITLPADGAGSFPCHGDTVLPPTQTLAYGKTLTAGSLSCTSMETGMTCSNGSGHRFRLARASYELT